MSSKKSSPSEDKETFVLEWLDQVGPSDGLQPDTFQTQSETFDQCPPRVADPMNSMDSYGDTRRSRSSHQRPHEFLSGRSYDDNNLLPVSQPCLSSSNSIPVIPAPSDSPASQLSVYALSDMLASSSSGLKLNSNNLRSGNLGLLVRTDVTFRKGPPRVREEAIPTCVVNLFEETALEQTIAENYCEDFVIKTPAMHLIKEIETNDSIREVLARANEVSNNSASNKGDWHYLVGKVLDSAFETESIQTTPVKGDKICEELLPKQHTAPFQSISSVSVDWALAMSPAYGTVDIVLQTAVQQGKILSPFQGGEYDNVLYTTLLVVKSKSGSGIEAEYELGVATSALQKRFQSLAPLNYAHHEYSRILPLCGIVVCDHRWILNIYYLQLNGNIRVIEKDIGGTSDTEHLKYLYLHLRKIHYWQTNKLWPFLEHLLKAPLAQHTTPSENRDDLLLQ